MLFIVSTPIGNLQDITLRALETLRNADLIACEDTRRTGRLLKAHGITNKVTSYHDFNKESKTKQLISFLNEGKDIALVTDSGTPAISDPGYYLVNECIREGIAVSPIPGPSAAIAAISASGLPTDRFTFYGFLPKKAKKKSDILSSLKDKCETSIFYESPHRINKTLDLISQILPDKRLCIARELTKRHEEFIRGSPVEMANKDYRGEIVLMIGT